MGRLGYRPALDGLRGIAIAAVVAYHFALIPGGFLGVDLFFVLSGFLITSLLLEERTRVGTVALSRFYVRRARRLLPALVWMLMVCGMFGALIYPPRQLITLLAGSVFYFSNFVRAFATPDPFTATFVNHLWSLAEEEQFYLVWPITLTVLLRRNFRPRRILLGLGGLFVTLSLYRVLLVTVSAASERHVYYGPDMRADGLVVGCAAAFLWQQGAKVRSVVGAAALAFALVCLAAARATVTVETELQPLFEIAVAATILAALSMSWLTGVLAIRPLVWLGKISYSLYLWQMPALWFGGNDHRLVAVIVLPPLTLFSYYVVEKPFRGKRRERQEPVDLSPAYG